MAFQVGLPLVLRTVCLLLLCLGEWCGIFEIAEYSSNKSLLRIQHVPNQGFPVISHNNGICHLPKPHFPKPSHSHTWAVFPGKFASPQLFVQLRV